MTNASPGSGTLVAGPATLQVQLFYNGALAATRTSFLTLVDAHFTSASTNPNPILIGGATQAFSAALANAGSALTSVSVVANGPPGRDPADRFHGAGAVQRDRGQLTQWHAARSPVATRCQTMARCDGGAATLSLVARVTDAIGHVSSIDSTGVPITLVCPPSVTGVSTLNSLTMMTRARRTPSMPSSAIQARASRTSQSRCG